MRSRQKIIDATLSLIADSGFEAASIAAVATAAGVSRQTVYSIFGTREDLVSQAIITETAEVFAEIAARTATTTSPTEFLVETLLAGRDTVSTHGVLGALLRSSDANPLFDSGMFARARPVAQQLLRPMGDRFPEIASRLDDIVEITLRLGVAVVLFDQPGDTPDADLRALLTRWLGPALTV